MLVLVETASPPRKWGSTLRSTPHDQHGTISPTHVGIHRGSRQRQVLGVFPRSRGDPHFFHHTGMGRGHVLVPWVNELSAPRSRVLGCEPEHHVLVEHATRKNQPP